MAFEAVNHLLYNNPKKELDNELLSEFSPFLTTKSFSFYADGQYVNYVNDTLNVYSHIFTTTEDTFRFFENVIPKLKRIKSTYIKKPKKEVVKCDPIPVPEFYSRREIDLLTSLNL